MRVSVVHNREAGRGVLSRKELTRALVEAGHEIVERGEVIIVAGGDGTVTREASRLVDQRVPLIVLPIGTANNVARSLGYHCIDHPLKYMLDVLASHDERDFDVGQSRTRYGRRLFYEGAGVGLFADALDQFLTDEDKEPRHAAQMLHQLLERYTPLRVEVTLDGVDASGEFMMLDVMNVARFGPKLHLTPHATPFDGLFDVALVGPDEIGALSGYLEALGNGQEVAAPRFEVRRARRVQLRLHGRKLRLDGKLHPRTDVSGAHSIELDVLPGALRVWLPRASIPPAS